MSNKFLLIVAIVGLYIPPYGIGNILLCFYFLIVGWEKLKQEGDGRDRRFLFRNLIIYIFYILLQSGWIASDYTGDLSKDALIWQIFEILILTNMFSHDSRRN